MIAVTRFIKAIESTSNTWVSREVAAKFVPSHGLHVRTVFEHRNISNMSQKLTWGVPQMEVPQNGWFVRGNPT